MKDEKHLIIPLEAKTKLERFIYSSLKKLLNML